MLVIPTVAQLGRSLRRLPLIELSHEVDELQGTALGSFLRLLRSEFAFPRIGRFPVSIALLRM